MLNRLKKGDFSFGDITILFAILFVVSLMFKIQGLEAFSLIVLIVTSFASVYEMIDKKGE